MPSKLLDLSDSLEHCLENSASSETSVDDIKAVLCTTKSLFTGDVKVEVSVDPEYPERPSIVFRVVNAENLSIEEVLDKELQWQREIGKIAPDSRDRLRLFVD